MKLNLKAIAALVLAFSLILAFSACAAEKRAEVGSKLEFEKTISKKYYEKLGDAYTLTTHISMGSISMQMKIAQKNGEMYIEAAGTKSIIKGEKMYTLDETEKVAYESEYDASTNENIMAEKEMLEKAEFTVVEKEIDGVKYYGEEFEIQIDELNQKTKMVYYFNENDELTYISANMSGVNVDLKVQITEGAESSLFEIPKDYKVEEMSFDFGDISIPEL